MSWTETQAEALAAAFAALDTTDIAWLVMRNHQGLPDDNCAKDVDLGVADADQLHAEKVILQALHPLGFDRVLVQKFLYARCLTLFNVQGDTPKAIKIDLMDGLAFRGAHVLSVPEIYRNARKSGALMIPSEADDAALVWAKSLLAGGKIKDKYIKEIELVLRKDPRSLRTVLNSIAPGKVADAAWAMINVGDIAKTTALRRRFRRAAWAQSLRRHRAATLLGTLRHAGLEISRRFWRTPASLLAVMGPDGVGKSTFIDQLVPCMAELKSKGPDEILVQHFRPRLLPNINQLLTGKPEVVSEFNNPHGAAPASMPSSLVRITYYWMDYVIGYWGKLRRLCNRDRTVIFDRYFYDFIVDPRRSRISLPGWIPRLYLALTPKPDLVFFLDAEPSEIFARKQELQPDEIARQLAAYRALAERDPGRFVRLDASQPPDLVARDALRAMIERSYPKVRT